MLGVDYEDNILLEYDYKIGFILYDFWVKMGRLEVIYIGVSFLVFFCILECVVFVD